MTLESQSCHSENSVVPSGYSSINSRTGFLRQCESLRTAPLTREQEIHEDLFKDSRGAVLYRKYYEALYIDRRSEVEGIDAEDVRDRVDCNF